MISFLRQKSVQRGLFLTLCVLVIPGFVFLSTTHDSSVANGTAGTVGKSKIKVQEFIRNFEAMRRELEVFGGVDLSKLGASIDLEQLAWQRILLVKAAKDSGIRVTDEDIVAWIREQKVFREDEAFSQERYDLILERYLKMDPKAFEEEVREYIALQRYRDQIRGTYQPQESELRERFRLLYGPRQLEYAVFTKESVVIPEALATEDELRAMYNRLSGRLFSQESVQLRYLVILADTPLPEGDAETAKWEADSVRTPFIAREDAIPGIGSAPALSEAVFALKTPGDRTAWLEHDGKKYRFELIEHKGQAPMAYDDAKQVLEQLVSQEKVYRAVMEKASAFIEKAKSAGWAETAAAEKIELQKIPAWVSGDYIEKVGKLGSVDKVLVELKSGDLSELIPTSNGLAIFKVIAQTDPDAKLFDAKRADLEKDLRMRHEMDVFGKALNALQSNLTVNPKVLAKLFPAKYSDPSTPASTK